MTIEELERGMKLLFDQQVQFADDLAKSQERQDRTDQQIAALAEDHSVTMKAITAVVAMVGDLAEAQKRTDISIRDAAEAQQRTATNIRELTESQRSTDAMVASLARRIDAFIAALGNGHKQSP